MQASEMANRMVVVVWYNDITMQCMLCDLSTYYPLLFLESVEMGVLVKSNSGRPIRK